MLSLYHGLVGVHQGVIINRFSVIFKGIKDFDITFPTRIITPAIKHASYAA